MPDPDRPTTTAPDPNRCPKCQWVVGAAMECPRCGVILAKVHSPAPGSEGAPLADHGFEARPATSRAPLLVLLLLFAVVAVYAVGQVGGADDLEVVGDETGTQSVPTEARSSRSRPVRTERASAAEPAFDEGVYYSAEDDSRMSPSAPSQATYSYDWYEDAGGLRSALEEAERDGRALAVYFRTDWCGYCRQLESELLTHGEVEDYMKYLVKVRINPDHGPREKELAKRYGVRGYPSLFVHRSPAKQPVKISRTKGGQLKTAGEFVTTLRRAAEG